MKLAEIYVVLALLLVSRILIPKLLSAESAGKKYGIGVCLFGIYTMVSLAMFRYVCTFDGSDIAQMAGQEVWTRVRCAFLLVNAIVVFVSGIVYLTRDKRKLSQQEKMKLKDL